MKCFVYIFSLYLLILSGFTCDAADDCCKDENKTEAANEHDDNDHKPVIPCIPFLACGACHSVPAPQIDLEIPQPFMQENKFKFYYSESSFTVLAFSFWQPPQIS